MGFRRRVVSVASGVFLLGSGVFVAVPEPAVAAVRQVAVVGAAATPRDECSTQFFDGDSRLGPEKLAKDGPVAPIVTGYHRLAGLSPQEFLNKFFDPTANGGRGGYRFPPANGFVIDRNGQPEEMPLSLVPFEQIDRFGSEFGGFLAPVNTPYASRSIPPQSLDNFDPAFTCNYHRYRVIKSFRAEVGPIAPFFGQRGLGRQYQLDATLVPGAPTPLTVLWLVDNGFLQRID